MAGMLLETRHLLQFASQRSEVGNHDGLDRTEVATCLPYRYIFFCTKAKNDIPKVARTKKKQVSDRASNQ